MLKVALDTKDRNLDLINGDEIEGRSGIPDHETTCNLQLMLYGDKVSFSFKKQ